MEKINLEELRNGITDDEVIDIMKSLGADRYKVTDKAICFPTICHNVDVSNASLKLYYYTDSKLFYCYTECAQAYNIFSLIKQVLKLRNKDCDFKTILSIIFQKVNIQAIEAKEESQDYDFIKKDYESYDDYHLKIYNKNVLNGFSNYKPVEWLADGISEDTMDKYNIKYSIEGNKVVIPHYDIDGNLVGIRCRHLNDEDAQLFGKYRPIYVNGIEYTHPLGLNLYGIDKLKKEKLSSKKIIIYEGEKGVCQHNSMFKCNNSVAVCGSTINKYQIFLLTKNFDVNEIIIAFDKEYDSLVDSAADRYFNKLYKMCNKYKHFCNMSFIYDKDNLLNIKDSPIDKGKEIFVKLYNSRVEVK